MAGTSIFGVPGECAAGSHSGAPYVVLLEPGARIDSETVVRLADVLHEHPEVGLAFPSGTRRPTAALARRRALDDAGHDRAPLTVLPHLLERQGWRTLDESLRPVGTATLASKLGHAAGPVLRAVRRTAPQPTAA